MVDCKYTHCPMRKMQSTNIADMDKKAPQVLTMNMNTLITLLPMNDLDSPNIKQHNNNNNNSRRRRTEKQVKDTTHSCGRPKPKKLLSTKTKCEDRARETKTLHFASSLFTNKKNYYYYGSSTQLTLVHLSLVALCFIYFSTSCDSLGASRQHKSGDNNRNPYYFEYFQDFNNNNSSSKSKDSISKYRNKNNNNYYKQNSDNDNNQVNSRLGLQTHYTSGNNSRDTTKLKFIPLTKQSNVIPKTDNSNSKLSSKPYLPNSITSSRRIMSSAQGQDEFLYDQFPSDFKFGVATSSYQIEGGWNSDGKGENIWDVYCHQTPSPIKDKSSGDVACDSYHKYKEDVQLVKNLNAKVYRISISWARILPKGTTEKVNQAGIEYYNNVINELISNGIEPMLTLFHWDLPQNIQEMGGFQNEEIIGIFADYARICYQNFGDRVKRWITINEPYIYCMAGYDWGIFPPAVRDPAISPYQCVHTMIKTHAMAYHIYKEEFSTSQKGKVGISVDSWWYEPADHNNKEDVEAAERALQFRMGWVVGPLTIGDYPKVMRELIDRHSKLENRSESRLPYFSSEWTGRIKGSIDFIGLNHYTTELVKPAPPEKEKPSWSSDSETLRYHDPSWPSTGSAWLKVVPFGLRKLLVWMKNEYNNTEIFITENGTSDTGGLKDTQRSDYFRLYINEVLKAVKVDGVNCTGYLAWSLMDVFEWDVGYTQKFGIYSVDFNDPDRKRTPKESAQILAQIFKDNGFPKHKLAAASISNTILPDQDLPASKASNFPFCTLTVLCFFCFSLAFIVALFITS